MKLTDDLKESVEDLLYLINNPDENSKTALSDIKGAAADVKFLVSKLKLKDIQDL